MVRTPPRHLPMTRATRRRCRSTSARWMPCTDCLPAHGSPPMEFVAFGENPLEKLKQLGA